MISTNPPVKKSGYNLNDLSFKDEIEHLINSLKLCGKIFVDSPTAMPSAPIDSKRGNFDGKISGSLFLQS